MSTQGHIWLKYNMICNHKALDLWIDLNTQTNNVIIKEYNKTK
jgi:hypothetical protein